MIELAVLGVLTDADLHGYELKKRLRDVLGPLSSVSFGSLYPALHRLEEQGWIASEWGVSDNNRQAKFYRLTRAGERQLQRESASWAQVSLAVTRILESN